MKTEIGFEIKIPLPYEQALDRVIAQLKIEGFGVLTRIDVKATLKEKLGVDFRPYTILGACNPPLALRALSAEPAIGLLLPCNLTIEESPQGETIVRIADPEIMMKIGEISSNPEIFEVANQARQKLEKVALALTRPNQ